MNTTLAPLVALLLARAGLLVDGPMKGRLVTLVERRAAESGDGISAVVAGCLSSPGALAGLVDELTVKETYFMREPNQLSAFVEHVLPSLPDPVTVWSAACATGQEPYSLAMLLREAGRFDATIVASDIASSAVARTSKGWYAPRELRGLDLARRDRWMVPEDGGWRVQPEIHAMVRAQRHNLVTDPSPFGSGRPSVIFLRNVLIYFPSDVCSSLLERMSATLQDDGWLFLGAGETLSHSPQGLRIEQLPSAFAYRRAAPASRAQVPPPRRTTGLPALVRTRARARSEADDTLAYLSAAEAALSVGDYPTAVAAYRKAAYLNPTAAEPQVRLAFALEASGDLPAASRAFGVAVRLVRQAGHDLPASILEGFTEAAFLRLLEERADPTLPLESESR